MAPLQAHPANALSVTPTTTIVLRGWSSLADNVGALIQLRYDGRVIAREEMRNSSVSEMVFRVPTRIDGGILDVIFSNATDANGVEARQLNIQEVIVNGTAFASTGPRVTYDTGHGPAAFDGLGVLPGTSHLRMTGALRFPMPAAAALGLAAVDSGLVMTADPGPYVDRSGGSDTYTGTASRPFKTLARLRSVQLLAGENIHLRCGGLWRESLELGVSQLADGTQLLPYGDCVKDGPPHISGADTFNGGWSRSGNVWSRQLPPGTPQITQLLVGWTAMHPARWPNHGTPAVVATQVSVGDPTAFAIAAAEQVELQNRDLSGAEVLLRTKPWRVEARRLDSQPLQSSRLRVTTAPESPVQVGGAYVLRGKAWMLDAPGEFFHDLATQRLSLIAASADDGTDLNAVTIEGSVRDIAVDWRERRGLVIKGIRTRMARGDGIRLTNAPEAVISGVESTVNGAVGVRLLQWTPLPAGANGPRVDGSTIGVNGESGIDTRYVEAAVVTNNRITETGIGVNAGPVGAGIWGGPAARIENNRVDRSAYVAIAFTNVRGSQVSRNEVSSYCLRLSDCAGIYTWTGVNSSQQSALIEGNRLHTASAVSTGSTSWGHDLVAGIYLDDRTRGVIVRGNFIHAVPVGIFVHNSALNTIENNRVWMPTQSGIAVSMDHYDNDYSFGNLIQGNEVVPFTKSNGSFPSIPTFTSSHAIAFTHVLSGEAALAPGRNEFRANRVIQLHGETTQHAAITGTAGLRFVNAATWKQLNPGEPFIEQPLSYSSYWTALGPETVPDGEFDAGLGGWGKHWSWASPGYAVEPVRQAPACNGPCIRFTSANPGDMIFSPPFTMKTGALYLYRYKAIGSGGAVTVNPAYIARAESPWNDMADGSGYTGRSPRSVKAGQVLDHESFFVPTSSAPSRVMFQLETQGVPMHVDSVSVRQVTMWLGSGPSEWVAPVIAAPDSARTVTSCGDIGLPAWCTVARLDGAPQGFPFTVPVNDAQLLLWSNSPYRK